VLIQMEGIVMSPKRRSKPILSITISLCLLLTFAWQPAPVSIRASAPAGRPNNPLAASSPPNTQPSAADTLSFTAFDVGSAHTCGLLASGVLKCWGNNWTGQLGDGTQIDRSTPGEVIGLDSSVTALSNGSHHTCARLSTGAVQCWGSNWSGQAGDGTSGNNRLTPVEVVGLDSGVLAVSAGSAHSCALLVGGGVKCWGQNTDGQLGDGTYEDRLTPVDVSGLTSGVLAISAGSAHTCALLTGGGLQCWGYNGYGSLGDGTNSNSHTPVDVSGLTSGVSAVSAGSGHSCALLSGGTVKCWGQNTTGQLGDGTTDNRWTPVDVIGLGSGVDAVSAGGGHSCALLTGGVMKCWGSNFGGELGDGSMTHRSTPVDVIGLGRVVTAMAAGMNYTCARLSDGAMNCWGQNGAGQLGDGTMPYRAIPVDVITLADGLTDIVAGAQHTCGLLPGGGLKCWGWNADGELGDGTTIDRSTPVDVIGLDHDVTALTLGWAHTCARLSGGGVKCWGFNYSGQLGDGTTDNRSAPVDVTGLGGSVTAIAAGESHTCALLSTGGVQCWGVNSNGELGDGTYDNHPTPVGVSGLASGVTAIAAEFHHTCALLSSGGVKCWGYNLSGQLGDDTITVRNTPVEVVGLSSGVLAITAGSAHTCALMAGGGVKCWGDSIGNGLCEPTWSPEDVIGLTSGVTAISAGGSETCALLTSGGMQCWGDNRSGPGQLGDGTTEDHCTPGEVSGMADHVTAITAGGGHTCALVGAGRPKCWGSDQWGQLGTGKIIRWPLPVYVVERSPSLGMNYAAGLPGSSFTLTGWDFPPGASLTLSINNQVLTTTLTANPTGGLILFLDTTEVEAGGYGVQVSGSPSASTSFLLANFAPVRALEGGGMTFFVPAGIAIQDFEYVYLPLLAR
jgi:alpha-tubulin suppressor-like RCC1 family protein